MADLTRRAFLKGTAKTILTGATIAAGGLSTTSTTPVKVLPAAKSVMKWKNLNVLSPKAKAYRVFLKGLIGRGTGGRFGWGDKTSLKTLLNKSGPTTSGGFLRGKHVAYRGATAGRQAFETATKKPVGDGTYARSNSWVANQGIDNPAASNIAVDMRTEKRSRNRKAGAEMKTVPQVYHRGTQKLTANLARGARNILAGELWEYRKANPDRMFKKMSARKHSENMKENKKTKSKGAKVGGGGKMALPGMESAKNPTGMSLITQRYTL